jgi:hypothetical protein
MMKGANFLLFALATLFIQTSIAKDFDASITSWPDVAVDANGRTHVVMLQYKTSGAMCTGYRIIHYRQLDENNWEKIVVYDKNIEPTLNFHPGKPSLCYGDGFLHLVYAERSYNNDAWRAVYKTYSVLAQPSYWRLVDTINIQYDNEPYNSAISSPFGFDICYGATPSFIQSYTGTKCPHIALRFGPHGDKSLYYYYYYNGIGNLYFISDDVFISGLADSFSIYVPLETYDRFSLYYVSDDQHAINMATLAGIGPTGPFWTSEEIITEYDPFLIDGVSSMEIPLDHIQQFVYYTTYNGVLSYLKYKYHGVDSPGYSWHAMQDYIDDGPVRYISNSSCFLYERPSGHLDFGVVYEKGVEGDHEILYAMSYDDCIDFWHCSHLIDDSDQVLGQSPKADRFGLDVVYMISGAYGSRIRYTKVDLDQKAREVTIPERKGVSSSDTALHVYPNPACETVTILVEPRDYTRLVSMYDIAGRLCTTLEIAPGTRILGLDVSDFTSGCYVLTCDDTSSSRRAVPLVIAH